MFHPTGSLNDLDPSNPTHNMFSTYKDKFGISTALNKINNKYLNQIP